MLCPARSCLPLGLVGETSEAIDDNLLDHRLHELLMNSLDIQLLLHHSLVLPECNLDQGGVN